MKQKRDTEEQIIGFLKAHEAGTKATELIRELLIGLETQRSRCLIQFASEGSVSASLVPCIFPRNLSPSAPSPRPTNAG